MRCDIISSLRVPSLRRDVTLYILCAGALVEMRYDLISSVQVLSLR